MLALTGRELCVCQITELLGLATSTVSKHISILRNAGLVEGRKEGRWIYYRLADAKSPPEARKAIAWVKDSLSKDRRTHDDKRELKRILKIDPEELCRSQCRVEKNQQLLRI